MIVIRNVAATLAATLAALASNASNAQSTDGYHAIQVFPVVVDTASFVERLVLRNPNDDDITVKVRYVPAEGTSQAGPLNCPDLNIWGKATFSYEGLRSLCPALPAGSQFGYLYTWTESYNPDRTGLPFSGFSRVQNGQGIGFSVEAFPAHAFTSAQSVVTGLRRSAATVNSPAYQTNCFVGNLLDVSPLATPVASTVSYQLTTGDFNTLIGSGSVNLVPGKMVRLLDVFESAGVPPGNYDNIRVRFEESGNGEPALITFCTVQDNTSFGADFRIGKQEQGLSEGSLIPNPFGQDDGALRESLVGTDIRMPTGPGMSASRPFVIPVGETGNTHVMYFRHPDWVACDIINAATGVRALRTYGLELRLVASDGLTVLAGGNDVEGFAPIYLGDKGDRDNGANTRYTLQVESNENNIGSARPYQVFCRSGSGHSLGELLLTNGANQF
ncbi:MAG: hypothetical protein A3E01_14665 [Gammaproteobacteria bacterium RIFCSPHIGHO2_12_FULL_63_22]|nr:MAG: hypothetical protein A3E01_14665 [Gammaproteobacteria bacterium RIFCSPHIGHO2_12_FULL_63_22]